MNKPVRNAVWMASDDDQDELLILGAKGLNVNTINYALKNGANVNFKEPGGSTALMWACIQNSRESVAALLAIPDIDVHLTNHSGESALSLAIARRCNNALELLLRKYPGLISTKIKVGGEELSPLEYLRYTSHDWDPYDRFEGTYKLLIGNGAEAPETVIKAIEEHIAGRNRHRQPPAPPASPAPPVPLARQASPPDPTRSCIDPPCVVQLRIHWPGF